MNTGTNRRGPLGPESGTVPVGMVMVAATPAAASDPSPSVATATRAALTKRPRREPPADEAQLCELLARAGCSG